MQVAWNFLNTKWIYVSQGGEKIGLRGGGRTFEPIFQPPPQVRPLTKLTGLNHTSGSAYLSARRTYRLGVLIGSAYFRLAESTV